MRTTNSHRIWNSLTHDMLLNVKEGERKYTTEEYTRITKTTDRIEHFIIYIFKENCSTLEGTSFSNTTNPQIPTHITDTLFIIYNLIAINLRIIPHFITYFLINKVTIHDMLTNHFPRVIVTAMR